MFAFNQIRDNEELIDSTRHLVLNGRFPHAALFLGNEGNEKLKLAYATARYLLCENPSATDICGDCNNCHKSAHFSHPDILFSFPFIKSGDVNQCLDCINQWLDAVRQNPYLNVFEWVNKLDTPGKIPNINVTECLRIVKDLSMRPFLGDKKVMIIWMPEYLSKEGNRLLKIIEEPPENTYILFVAEDKERILGTIISRCQTFRVAPMSSTDVADILQQEFGKDRDSAELVAGMSNGSVMEALSLYDDNNQKYNQLLIDWLRLCYILDREALVKWSEEFNQLSREVQKYILRFGAHFFLQLIRQKWNYNLQNSYNDRWDEIIKNLIPLLDYTKINQSVEMLEEAQYFVDRNCNMKIQMINISIKMHQLLRNKLVTN
jgi:DNA polymerase-3 subunit delta'